MWLPSGGCGYILRQRSLADRFVPLLSPDWTKSLYCDPFEDYNIFAYATKCSVFGETALSGSGVAAAALLVCAFILITGALTAMVYVLARAEVKEPPCFSGSWRRSWRRRLDCSCIPMSNILTAAPWISGISRPRCCLGPYFWAPRASGFGVPKERSLNIWRWCLLRRISVLCQRRLFIPYAFLNGRGTVRALSRGRSAESAGTP